MATRRNPLKLNKLQRKSLAVLQMIAAQEESSRPGPREGEVSIERLPTPHGDHLHLGPYVLQGRETAGLMNPAVWSALLRKGLVREFGEDGLAVTPAGLDYDTDYELDTLRPSDH